MINNNNMNGKINGKNIWDFVAELDWTIDTIEDRLFHVRKVLGEYNINSEKFYHTFFEEVFNQDNQHSKVKLVLNTTDARYDESNISKALEIIESYILCSPDEIENRKKEKIKYRIYNSKQLEDRFKQEENLIYKLASVNSDRSNNYDKSDNRFDGDFENVFSIFQLPKNYKKAKDIKITSKDFEKYPILKEYQQSINHMKDKMIELMKINEEEIKDKELLKDIRNKKKLIKKNLKSLKLDMLDVKKMLEKPIIWKAPLKDNGCPDYDMLDMFDTNVIKELLRVKKEVDLQDDLSCILVDLDNLIKKINFTNKQKDVLELWRKGLETNVIADELNVNSNNVVQCLNGAINLIVKQYEEDYENWYYLNIRKGQYKTCSRCGDVKLISQFDKNGKKGLRSCCKKCESLRKKK